MISPKDLLDALKAGSGKADYFWHAELEEPLYAHVRVDITLDCNKAAEFLNNIGNLKDSQTKL